MQLFGGGGQDHRAPPCVRLCIRPVSEQLKLGSPTLAGYTLTLLRRKGEMRRNSAIWRATLNINERSLSFRSPIRFLVA